MWIRFLFVFCAWVLSSTAAWNPGTDYAYKVQSRTLSVLRQVGDQYSGMIMSATLKLHAQSASKLYAKVTKPEIANVHHALPGWGSPILDQDLLWQRLEMSGKPFIIQLRNGVIGRLEVYPATPEWEVNLIKGIVSQLQVDASAENYFNSRISNRRVGNPLSAVYRIMEDSVVGKCEVLYAFSLLSNDILREQLHLVPKPDLNPEGAQILDIVKRTNFSHCEKNSSDRGQFYDRSFISRIVAIGRPNKRLIQSSVTSNKVIFNPMAPNQKSMVVNRMNLTLLTVNADQSDFGWEDVQGATHQVNSLVYNLKNRLLGRKRNKIRKNQQKDGKERADSSTTIVEAVKAIVAAAEEEAALKTAQKKAAAAENAAHEAVDALAEVQKQQENFQEVHQQDEWQLHEERERLRQWQKEQLKKWQDDQQTGWKQEKQL